MIPNPSPSFIFEDLDPSSSYEFATGTVLNRAGRQIQANVLMLESYLYMLTGVSSPSGWLIGATYAQGGLVSYNGRVFLSLQNSNTGNTPADGAFWRVLNKNYFHIQDSNWDASSGSYPINPESGDLYIVGTAGTVSSIIYEVDDFIVWTGSTWKKLGSTGGSGGGGSGGGGGPQPTVRVTDIDTTAADKETIICLGPVTVTLPLSPTVDSEVTIVNKSLSGNPFVDRNGELIESLPENMEIDLPLPTPNFVYSGLSRGWLVYGVTRMLPSFGTQTFIYPLSSSQTVYNINHQLGKYPSVTLADSSGNEVIGNVKYIDSDNLQVTTSSAVDGHAYLN